MLLQPALPAAKRASPRKLTAPHARMILGASKILCLVKMRNVGNYVRAARVVGSSCSPRVGLMPRQAGRDVQLEVGECAGSIAFDGHRAHGRIVGAQSGWRDMELIAVLARRILQSFS